MKKKYHVVKSDFDDNIFQFVTVIDQFLVMFIQIYV